jgi:hypothetical protein
MSIARSVADVLRDQVVLEYEAIDRMYLNVYVPHLQVLMFEKASTAIEGLSGRARAGFAATRAAASCSPEIR